MVPARNIKIVITMRRMGDPIKATLSFLGENPPVDNVEKQIHIASKMLMPPAISITVSASVRMI